MNVVSSNPCVGPLPRIKMCFPSFSICADMLVSTPWYQHIKIMTSLPTLPSSNENSERKSNSIPWPLYPYLSRSAFLANLTPSNKQPNKVKLKFKSHDHVSYS